MNSDSSKKDNCPYFSDNPQECRVTKGGLYIPMPKHIQIFCETPKFIKCDQYVTGCEVSREVAKKYGYILDESRRRYRRIRERFSLNLAESAEDGELFELLDNDAFTLDMSLGGFCFESRTKIPPHKLIAFSFGHDFPSSWLGTGEIRWTKDLDHSEGYQSGLAFTDSRSFQAIGRHMGLSGLPMM